mgnify:FL=1
MLRGATNDIDPAGPDKANTPRPDMSTKAQRRRLMSLAAIMVAVVSTAGGVALSMLYRVDLDRQSELLRELALGEARLIETVIANQSGPNGPADIADATLANLTADLARRLPKAAFGESGEFILARRQGDQIILSRRGDPFVPGPTLSIPMQSDLAAPARFGLMGKSGMVTVLDYAGVKVLAAHEPVPGHKLAVVAKIDLAEVQSPFVWAAIVVFGGLTVFLILVIGGWHHISLNIRRREQALAKLRESEARLSRTERIANLGGWQYDLQTSEYTTTDQAFRVFGLPRCDSAKALKMTFDLVHPDDFAEVQKARHAALKHGRTYAVDYRITRPDGEARNIHEQSAFEFDAFGNRLRISGIVHDVTEKIRAEEALRNSEQRLAGILRLAPEAVITIDTEQRITLFSETAAAMFGYTAAEVLGQPLDMLIPDAVRGGHKARVETFAGSPESSIDLDKRQDTFGQRKDGSIFPTQASVSKLLLENETVFTVLLHDISERKQAEQALLAAKHQAEAANRTKSEFLANMSHELRTPLNAILGFSQMMMAGMVKQKDGSVDGDKVQEYATDIFDSGSHLLGVISDLLDLAKIEAGHTDLDEDEVNMDEVIITSLRQIDGGAREAGLQVISHVPDDLPLLWADERKLKQVVLNLLTNAVKFTARDGEIEIAAKVLASGEVELSVRDTGHGMTAAEVELSLQPFGQVNDVMTRVQEGTGLGLPLSKSLCQLHGGELEIKSSKGTGTTVVVRLPQSRIIAGQDAAPAFGIATAAG